MIHPAQHFTFQHAVLMPSLLFLTVFLPKDLLLVDCKTPMSNERTVGISVAVLFCGSWLYRIGKNYFQKIYISTTVPGQPYLQ